MFETGKIFDNFAQMDFTVLYWIIGATIALILVIVVAHLLRYVFAGRVRQIQEFGMDFDAVTDMLDKGLLTPDEVKRVKSVLTRHFTRLYEQRFGSQSVSDLSALAASEATVGGNRAGTSLPSPDRSFAQAGPAQAVVAPTAVPPRQTASPVQETTAEGPSDEGLAVLPLDILDMYRAGMITDDELAALRRFYAARARGSG